jgi:hypothetical protein
MNTPLQRFKRCQHVGLEHYLTKVRRTNFFLAFGDKHKIDWQLLARIADGVQRRQKRGFRSFLIDGSAADYHFAKPGLVNERRFKWRRRPLGRIHLLHVIHKVKTERSSCAGIQHREYSRLAIGRNFGNLRESGGAQHFHGQLTTFIHATVLGGDRRLPDPRLQTPHGLVMMLVDFRPKTVCSSGSWAKVTRDMLIEAAVSAAVVTKFLRFIGRGFLLNCHENEQHNYRATQ